MILGEPESQSHPGPRQLSSAFVLTGPAAHRLIKSWSVSYTGNFVGSLALAALVAAGGTLVGGGASVGAAVAKTSLPFKTALVRGILCNWLVCMAVWMASMAKDLPGKIVAIWFPISAFVALGASRELRAPSPTGSR